MAKTGAKTDGTAAQATRTCATSASPSGAPVRSAMARPSVTMTTPRSCARTNDLANIDPERLERAYPHTVSTGTSKRVHADRPAHAGLEVWAMFEGWRNVQLACNSG